MKVISWNVNGIRAVYKKGLEEFLENESPDILCIQETKAHPDQLKPAQLNPLDYNSEFSSAEKKGYSGVSVYYKKNLNLEIHSKGIQIDKFDQEGRFIIFSVADYLFYNIYFPSGTTGDLRQRFKYEFLDAVYDHLMGLSQTDKNRLIVCGDYNICHKEIDIHHPKDATRLELSGFLPDERAWMDKFTESGLTDSYRMHFPELTDKYTWWSYRAGARPKNLGWRIDYFFVADSLREKIKKADILSDVTGSDHAPIFLELG